MFASHSRLFSLQCLLPRQQGTRSASSTPHRKTSSTREALTSSSWAGESWWPPTGRAQPSRTGGRAGRPTPRDWAHATSSREAEHRPNWSLVKEEVLWVLCSGFRTTLPPGRHQQLDYHLFVVKNNHADVKIITLFIWFKVSGFEKFISSGFGGFVAEHCAYFLNKSLKTTTLFKSWWLFPFLPLELRESELYCRDVLV